MEEDGCSIVAYTDGLNPVFPLFKPVRDAVSDPECLGITVDETEIRFQPVKDEDEGLSVTQSTGDISAAGIVSNHDLDVDEGRYEAVALDDSTWAIYVGTGTPDPVGGRSSFVKELRDAVEE